MDASDLAKEKAKHISDLYLQDTKLCEAAVP
jgi:hypothetical protein